MLFVAADCNLVLVFVDTFLEFCCFLELVEAVLTFFRNAGFGVQAFFPTSKDGPVGVATFELSPL